MMSEMKPVARVDGRYSDDRAMVRTLDTGAHMPLGTELYTSEQLAEAVAAERERCAKVCEDLQQGDSDYYDAGCFQSARAIRSATK